MRSAPADRFPSVLDVQRRPQIEVGLLAELAPQALGKAVLEDPPPTEVGRWQRHVIALDVR